jgi:glycosyltransferase involved in cell wall biosynthesis
VTRFAEFAGQHPDPVPVVIPVHECTPPNAAAPGAVRRLERATRLLDEAIEIGQSSCSPRDSRFEKLIIQIPCFNEAGTIAITLADLPRRVAGFRQVEWLVIDDGSVDNTVEEALKAGVDHVVRLPRNRGLARAFMAGVAECVRRDADVIVNTDADNQYCGADIEKLVQPIIEGRADMVIGARPIMQTAHFSLPKKILQRVGSWVVRKASSAEIDDAPSGFRAMTRETAMRLNVFTDYTYTLETIIQAGQNNMAVVSVPIRTNADLRPSRLLKSIPSYVRRSASTILRIFMTYRPLSFFGIPGLVCCALSALLCFRYFVFWVGGSGAGHIQSLILAAILMSAGLLGVVVGLVGDLISVNRKLLEKVDWHLRQLQQQVEALSAGASKPAQGPADERRDGAP